MELSQVGRFSSWLSSKNRIKEYGSSYFRAVASSANQAGEGHEKCHSGEDVPQYALIDADVETDAR